MSRSGFSRRGGAAIAAFSMAMTQANAAPVEPASAPKAAAASRSKEMVIALGRDGANSKVVTLGLNKAMIVDLPADARDVLVSDPAVADAVVRTARRAYIIGRQIGQANIFFFDGAGRQIANIDLRIEPDLPSFHEMIARLVPKARVRAEYLNGSIVLSGTAPNEASARKIVDMAQVLVGPQPYTGSGGSGVTGGGPKDTRVVNLISIENAEQVLVKVRVVEMSRGAVKQFGVNLEDSNLNDGVFNFQTSNGFSINGDLLGGGQFFGQLGDEVDIRLDAFERMGLLRVLAEPNLTAVSGEAAKFLAGGEFPIPVGYDDGKIVIEFKPFGVGLTFTPEVLSAGRISLKLATEVSELTNEGAITTTGIIIPALQVRRAQTTVEMPSGGALVIAGLIQERTRQAMEGLPGAKDIPVLGQLFRSRDFLNNESELVIVVTPYLVKPTDPDNIRTPADGFQNASDLGSTFMGQLNKTYRTPASDMQGRKLSGPLGYALPKGKRDKAAEEKQ